jgi:hypothetical protein
MIGLLSRPSEAVLGHISLDRVIWNEGMADQPAARHRLLALRRGSRRRKLLAGGFAACDEVRSDARRLFRDQILGLAKRISVPGRCRSSTIVQDRIRDTSGTLTLAKICIYLMLLASPTGFEPVLPP